MPLCGLHVSLNIHILNFQFEEEFAMSDIPQNTAFNICAILKAKTTTTNKQAQNWHKGQMLADSSASQKLIYITFCEKEPSVMRSTKQSKPNP